MDAVSEEFVRRVGSGRRYEDDHQDSYNELHPPPERDEVVVYAPPQLGAKDRRDDQRLKEGERYEQKMFHRRMSCVPSGELRTSRRS